MFAAPPEQSLEWSDSAVEGAFRFLRSLWRLTHAHVSQGLATPGAAAGLNPDLQLLRRRIHATIAKVTDDFNRRYKFNTAIAAVMELLNALQKLSGDDLATRQVRQEGLETCVLLLAPIVPHCTEELWTALGHPVGALLDARWPVVEAAALTRSELELVIQVNGKKRGTLTVATDASPAVIEASALADPGVLRHLEGHTVRKVVVIPGRLVNIVAS